MDLEKKLEAHIQECLEYLGRLDSSSKDAQDLMEEITKCANVLMQLRSSRQKDEELKIRERKEYEDRIYENLRTKIEEEKSKRETYVKYFAYGSMFILGLITLNKDAVGPIMDKNILFIRNILGITSKA